MVRTEPTSSAAAAWQTGLRKGLPVLALAGAYALAFPWLEPQFGAMTRVFSLPFVLLAAWWGGLWWGFAAGILNLPLNLFLHNYYGVPFVGGAAGVLAGAAMGGLLGRARDLSRRWRDEALARQQTEGELAEAQSLLESRVAQRTAALSREVAERQKVEEALRQSEGRLAAIYHSSQDAIVTVDLTRCITSVNLAFTRLFGYLPAEVLGRSAEFLHPSREKFEEFGRLVLPVVQGRGHWRGEWEFLRKDGRLVPTEMAFSPLRLPGGEVIGYVTLHRDISLRRAAETSLRSSESELSAIYQAAPVMMILLDEDRRVIKANQAALDAAHRSAAEALGLRGGEMLHCVRSVDSPLGCGFGVDCASCQVRATVQDTLDTGQAHHRVEAPLLLDREGARVEVWALVSTSRLELAGRRTVLVCLEDITALKTALAERKQLQEKFTRAFRSSPVWVSIATQHEGRFLEVNDAFTALTGYTREEALGRTSRDLGLWTEAPFPRQKIVEAFDRDGCIRNLEMPMRFKDGKVHHMLWSADPFIFDGQDCVISVQVDITALKEAEAAKAVLEGQLLQAQKMEAIGTLAGGIAHDFNNILAAIMGYAELAGLAPTLGRDPAPDLARILSAAERARDLVRRILTFSRKVAAERRPLDLNQAVTRALGLLEHTLPRMVRLEARLFPGLAMVSADPNQMEQIILNLATNAADAMPGGGRLLLETRNVHLPEEGQAALPEIRPGEYALLEVADSGQGMDPATLEHIYDPFFTTKEVGKGTGLGLSTVYGIVKAHEGHILCESGPARGTVFRVFLPALGADAAAEASLAPAARPDQPGQETVWLVDDEEALREMGARLLESVGYQVRAAASGEELLAMYREAGQRPDLVILDLNMPGMGGEKCLRELLALDPRARILVASGYSSAGQAPDCLAAGAAAYLAKPFRLPDLLAAVREVLDRPPPEAPPA